MAKTKKAPSLSGQFTLCYKPARKDSKKKCQNIFMAGTQAAAASAAKKAAKPKAKKAAKPKTASGRPARSAAQKAATAKMIAANKAKKAGRVYDPSREGGMYEGLGRVRRSKKRGKRKGRR